MKTYFEARKEELRKRGESGFTLMEMLIVVAIIAVLIAIAIPVFTTQLEQSREATDLANVRSAYAEINAEYLTREGSSLPSAISVEAHQQVSNWQKFGSASKTTIGTNIGSKGEVNVPASKGSYVISIDNDGVVTVEAK